jgi:hypothetical protein
VPEALPVVATEIVTDVEKSHAVVIYVPATIPVPEITQPAEINGTISAGTVMVVTGLPKAIPCAVVAVVN